MRLTSNLQEESKINFKGRSFCLNLSFDNVLKALELSNDKTFTDSEKMTLWVYMFLLDEKDLLNLEPHDFPDFVQEAFKTISGDSEGSEEEVLYCFEQDADYIFSSFQAEYGMDLLEEQGKLHWVKFKSLLNGLSEKSKFKEVVSIRAAKIPPRTNENKEERIRLIELKRIYALRKTESIVKNEIRRIESKLNAFGERLSKKAGGENG